MKKNKSLFSILFWTICLLPLFSNGEVVLKDSIVISGKIGSKANIPDGSVFEVNIVQKNAYFNWYGYNKQYQTIVKDGKFRLSILTPNKLTYGFFNLIFPNKQRQYMNEGNTESLPYLMESGDQISMVINKLEQKEDYIVFTGKGSQKINCQQQIYQSKNFLPNGAFQRHGQLLNNLTESGLSSASIFFDLHYQMKLAILNSYKDSISKSAYEIIYYDCLGLRLQAQLTGLTGIEYRMDYLKYRPLIEQYLNESISKYKFYDTPNSYMVNSGFYTYAIANLELFKNKLDSSSAKHDFWPIYNSIKNNYKGELRDKLWLIAILKSIKYTNNTYNYIDTILGQMGENDSKAMLLKWKQRHNKGVQTYPFELADEKGRVYKLIDFKDKIIIADFWFTGCAPCRGMIKHLTPIAQQYRNNTDVVFLSINVDQNRARWEIGLKEGTYVIPGSIHLWTMGEKNISNPFLKYYNYTSFPQLLVIDKEGHLISSNPPHPALDKGLGLKQMIDDNLKRLR